MSYNCIHAERLNPVTGMVSPQTDTPLTSDEIAQRDADVVSAALENQNQQQMVQQQSDANSAAISGKVDKVNGKGLSTNDYTSADKTRLANVAAGATANDTDANLKNRSNHTGTQTAATISDFNAAVSILVQAAVNSLLAGAPIALDTLKELADAVNNDASFASSVTVALGNKVDKITGKGLSSNDFTSSLLTKLNSLTLVARAYSTPARVANTAYATHATQDMHVAASINITCSAAVISGQNGTVTLQYADNNNFSTNLVTISTTTGSASGVLNLNVINTANLSGIIPPNKFYRIFTTGTATFGTLLVQEVLL